MAESTSANSRKNERRCQEGLTPEEIEVRSGLQPAILERSGARVAQSDRHYPLRTTQALDVLHIDWVEPERKMPLS
jgi:hypothetical protein